MLVEHGREGKRLLQMNFAHRCWQCILQQETYSCSPIPLFILFMFNLQSLNPLSNPGLVDVAHQRVCGGPRADPPPPGVGGLHWLERCIPVAYCPGLLPPAVGMDQPGGVHFPIFYQRATALQSGKLMKVNSFNWLRRPENFNIFENGCDIWNQRIKNRQDHSVGKNATLSAKTVALLIIKNNYLCTPIKVIRTYDAPCNSGCIQIRQYYFLPLGIENVSWTPVAIVCYRWKFCSRLEYVIMADFTDPRPSFWVICAKLDCQKNLKTLRRYEHSFD